MKTFQHVTSIGLLIIGFSSSGCGTVKKVNAVLDSANQTAQSVNQLAKNFNETLNQLKAQAKTPTTAAPVSEASVPALPAMATGGIDTTKPVSGKSGSGMADIEGSGTAEPVTVFEADAMVVATNSVHTLGIATSDDATTFLAWQGTTEAGDEGQCYLGWEHQGKVWFEIAACGGTSAQVCSDDGAAVVCSACDHAGNCTPCDETKPLSACTPSAGTDAAEPGIDHDASNPDAG